jgi:hypothetical protein
LDLGVADTPTTLPPPPPTASSSPPISIRRRKSGSLSEGSSPQNEEFGAPWNNAWKDIKLQSGK